MVELFYAYWPVVLVALAIGIIVGFLVFRPRQRVRLTDSAPVRPHMTIPPGETVLEHEAEVTTRHVSGSEGPVPAQLSDELERLKGVGPKLASMLKAHGLTRYEHLAKLTDEEVDRLDADLGAFRGRLQRDRVVEQADYLARGDIDGFEQKFGKV